MHRQGVKRQKYTAPARSGRASTLKVYLSPEDRSNLRHIARELAISDSLAAVLAIRQFCKAVEAEKRDNATYPNPGHPLPRLQPLVPPKRA